MSDEIVAITKVKYAHSYPPRALLYDEIKAITVPTLIKPISRIFCGPIHQIG